MFHVSEESEKLIMSESPEYQGLKLSIGQKKFNNQMLELNVVYLILEKLAMNISHILFNVKHQLHAQLF